MTMAGEAELIVDRRRLRRRLVAWRVVACLAVIIALLALALGSSGFETLKKHRDHIARMRISGMITGDQPTLDLLKEIADSKSAKALIIRLDTPGGTTAGSEALYEAIRDIAKTRPVVAVMDTMAASGGYITAIAADHIVARGNTITGLIGVIFQWAEVSKLMEMLGVRMDEIKSGDLKAEPSPFKPITEKAREFRTPWSRMPIAGSPGWSRNGESCPWTGFWSSPTAGFTPVARPWPRSLSMTLAARKGPSTGW